MDNKIEIFKNEQFGEVRTILEGEKVLFCAADVAKALGYTNPNKAVNDHCRAITKRSTPISGKVQSINFIPEGDVYRLIIRSKLPAAEKFELWVFDEVIPTIRKTGGYMTDSLLERIQKEPAVIVEFAQALILEKNRVKALECELNTAKPKADYYDAFINPDDCTNIRTTAKELKIPERKFVQFLLREKYLFRSPSGQLLPYNKDSNFGTCLNARKTNQKPLSMPVLGVGRGSFFMTYSKLRTAALEPVAGIPALYPKYVWQAQGLPLLAHRSQR